MEGSMLKNGKKTIGVFVNRAELPLQYNFCRSVIAASNDYDYNIIFFAAYEIRESDNYYEVQGSVIVDFAPLEELDAVILALGTFGEGSRERIVDAITLRFHGPIISFKEEQNGFYNVVSGEDRGAGTLVRHLYSVHNVRRICFFADSNTEHFRESLRRETFYRDSMEECGLKVEEKYLFRTQDFSGQGEVKSL